MMIRDPDRGTLDPVATAVREDVVADASHVAAAEQLPERIVMAFLHGDDPHVDRVLTHRFGENAVELLAPDGAESLPPMSRVELGLRADLTDGEGKQCSEQSATNDSAI